MPDWMFSEEESQKPGHWQRPSCVILAQVYFSCFEQARSWQQHWDHAGCKLAMCGAACPCTHWWDGVTYHPQDPMLVVRLPTPAGEHFFQDMDGK